MMYRYIIFIGLFFFCLSGFAQVDIPDAPGFVSASVIPESNPVEVMLTWTSSDSTDVAGYIIYEVVNSITETIDTVWDRLTNKFVYSGSQSSTNPEVFRMAAFDNMFYKSQITSPHTTMFLSYEYDKCKNEVGLNWSAYLGWGGVKNYNIYRRKVSGSYEIRGSVSGTEITFTDDDVEMNETYFYYIEAISPLNYVSTSNSITLNSESYVLPSFMYAEYASVSDNDINLKFVVDNTAEVLEYRLQRSLSAEGGFTTINIISNARQIDILVSDTDSDPNSQVYYYRLASVNPCGIINSYSNLASNVLLNVLAADDLNHSLEWNQYEQWQNGVFNYRIYRYFGDVAAEIDVNPAGNLHYTYDVGWYIEYSHLRKVHTTNKFCYFVEAVENAEYPSSSSVGYSRSNIACVYHDPICWLPNAFNLSSYEPENRVFKPVLSFAQEEPYEFVIYDRWGNQIFKTEQTFEGWDGNLNHDGVAHSQYYTYFVRYFDYKNKEYLKTGTFFLFVE